MGSPCWGCHLRVKRKGCRVRVIFFKWCIGVVTSDNMKPEVCPVPKVYIFIFFIGLPTIWTVLTTFLLTSLVCMFHYVSAHNKVSQYHKAKLLWHLYSLKCVIINWSLQWAVLCNSLGQWTVASHPHTPISQKSSKSPGFLVINHRCNVIIPTERKRGIGRGRRRVEGDGG